jgi:hypothetical protein
MPAVKFIPFLVLILFFGCTKKHDISNKHGISMIPISQYTYRGVVERSINLQFDVKKSTTSVIIARVEMGRDYDAPLRYEWKLVEGLLKGEISSLKKDQPIDIELKVSGFDSEIPRFIRFEIMGANTGRPAFADGIVSSNEEKSFERIVQEVENYKKHEQEQ